MGWRREEEGGYRAAWGWNRVLFSRPRRVIHTSLIRVQQTGHPAFITSIHHHHSIILVPASQGPLHRHSPNSQHCCREIYTHTRTPTHTHRETQRDGERGRHAENENVREREKDRDIGRRDIRKRKREVEREKWKEGHSSARHGAPWGPVSMTVYPAL